MKRILLVINFITFLFFFFPKAGAQTNQVVVNGATTKAVNFTGSGCTYNWVNDKPGIGLPASGTGDINAFMAINNGKVPIIATISATSIPVQYAYIPGSNGITVINTSTNKVITTIPAGYSSANVAATPDGTKVYISDPLSNTVLVINTSTNTIMATITVGNLPGGITVTPDGKTVFVGNYNDNSISVISTATNKVTTVISGFDRPFQLRTAPVGNLLYVLSQTTGVTWVVNTTNNTVVNTLPVVGQPWDIAISSDGTILYIVGASDNSVHVFNATTYAAIATIPVGLTPENITISPDGNNIYVGCFNAGYVADISTATNTVTKNINMPFAHGLAVSADGKTLFAVDNYNPGSLNAIDIATGNLLIAIPTGYGGTAAGNFLAGLSCPSIKFTITVNPTPAFNPTITAGTATGTISACQGNASASPQVQQIKVVGAAISGNITATAPTGFEISLTAGSGYGGNLTLVPTAGAVNATIYVRSSATAATGTINGNVILTATGAVTQNVAVNGVVNALPTVTGVSNQTVVNGAPTTAVNFAGTGNTFTWTNDTPGIGLAASGAGGIASFNAVNTGTSAVKATITVTPSTVGYAYFDNPYTNMVTVVNTQTNSVVKSIQVGSGPGPLAVSPDGTRLYVSNVESGTISVIDVGSQTVVGTITVGSYPYGVAVSPDGGLLYVANQGSQNISVINTATNTVTSTISAGSSPWGIVASPDGVHVYVANYGTNTVTIVNINTQATSTVPVGTNPIGIAISPDGSRVYAVNFGANTVSVINTLTSKVIAVITVGSIPMGVTVSPDGKQIYVSNSDSNTVSVINAATNKVTTTVNVGAVPEGVSVDPNGGYVYVANTNNNTVSVISTATNTVTQTIPASNGQYSIGNFVSGSSICSGQPVKFTITVNPTPAAPPTITAGPVTGSISACAGMASVVPLVQQINISGSNLTGDITATAPAGFEVSTNENGGYGVTATLTQFGGAVGSGIFVRSSATAPAGNISGKVILTSPGAATQQLAVAGIVNAVPNVNTISNQTYTTGSLTTGVTFSGGANNFTWVNDTPGIGLAASGSGNITPFTAVNNGSSPVVANITVTPVNSGAAYIPNYGDGTVSIINTSTNTTEGVVKVGTNPTAAAVSPDGSKVFVANQNDNTISVIDVASGSVITAIPYGTSPNSMAITPDGSTLYVTNHGSNTVAVISTSNYQVLTDIVVGLGDFGVVISQDGSHVYVANSFGNSVSVISTASNTVIATIPVPNAPRGIAVSPDGSKIYVTNSGSNTVTVINTSTDAISAIITVGPGPDGITLSEDGKLAYVADSGSGSVSVINTSTGAVTATIRVGLGPQGIALTQGSSYLYVTNSVDNTVSVINTATNKVITTVNVGSTPISFGNFIAPSNGCPGQPVKFTITVNPAATAPAIIAGTATGTISACLGTASASPNIQQFTVSGSNLPGDILVAAPSVFEVSLSPNSGFGNFVTLKATGGVVNSTVVYVRSAAAASAGVKSGYIDLTSGGFAGPQVPVTETINALPTVNTVPNQSVNNGAATAAVNFTGSGNSFTWTNDTPGIGLAASGTGDIASFIAVNKGSTPVTATINITPSLTGYAYITNFSDNTVSVINTTTNHVVTTLPVGLQPFAVAVSPKNGMAYIANQQLPSQYSSTVSVIDMTSNKVVNTISLSGAYRVSAIVASPDGSRVYVVAMNALDDLYVINTATNAVVGTVVVGNNSDGLAISPDGKFVYVANYNDNNVVVVDATTYKIVSTITNIASPEGIVVSPDGATIYTAGFSQSTVSVISTASGSQIATIQLPINSEPNGIAISPDGNFLFVANKIGGTVSVINTATQVVVATIDVGGSPVGISLNSDAGLLYVANQGSNSVNVINTSTNKIVATIPVGSNPEAFGNFISNGSSCTGTPTQFTLTVNPSSPAITASIAAGTISACAGTASATPYIQQFTASGSNLTGDITATAPTGFEVSLTAGNGYSNSITLTQAGGTVNSTVVYVRSAATASTGNISGNVVLTSNGATSQNVMVTGTINALVTPSISIVASANNICQGTPVTFTALPANGGSAPVYQWMVNGSPVGTNSLTFSTSTLANGDAVTCVITSKAACITPGGVTSNSITMEVNLPLTPSLSAAVSANNICAGTPVTFTATPTNSGSAPVYQWMVNGNPAGTNSATFSTSTVANGDIVNCVMTTNDACVIPGNVTSNSITMNVNPLPTVNAGGNKTIKAGSSIQLNATASGNIIDITWSPSAGLSNNKILNPVASPAFTTTYTLTVQTASGCLGMDSATIEVQAQNIIIPNTFTPNGDGINDTWNIKYLDAFPSCSVQIFDRYGANVYSSTGYGVPWDGTYKGSAVPAGTYYYIINLKNGRNSLSGFVAIIR